MKKYFIDPYSGEAMYREGHDGTIEILNPRDTEIIQEHLKRSEIFYPEQYEALSEEYSNSSANKEYYDFLRARRIINCCFGDYDNPPEQDSFGHFHFKKKVCPLIAECKHYKKICLPTISKEMTESEWKVMELVFRNFPTDQIADTLVISTKTVNEHRSNALRRLCLSSVKEFMAYAFENKLFNE